jgi:serine/threonine-protein kinase RsbT
MAGELRVEIGSDADVVSARQRGRALAEECGFTSTDVIFIATAISEIARNIVAYADRGEMVMQPVERAGRRGIVVVARDQGPGVRDVNLAMRDGFSTGNGLGLGLPGSRRLMDDFEIVSETGRGTTVTMGKWLR